jgi:hypothetical protein
MSAANKARFVSPEWLPPNCDKVEELIRETFNLLTNEPGKHVQTRLSSLAMLYLTVALQRYGLGYPLEHVSKELAECAECWLKIFQLRGTEAPFPVLEVTLDARFPSNDPRALIEKKWRDPPGAKDYSVTNSRANLRAVCIAMCTGKFDVAAQIAALAWDPPDANYIGPNSVICRPYEVHLAYSVKHLFAAATDETLRELERVRVRPKDVRPHTMKAMIRSLIAATPEPFLDALSELLSWHAKLRWERDQYELAGGGTKKFLCFWALGLSAWAVQRGLVTLDQLPGDNVYCPRELIALNVGKPESRSDT